MVTVTIEVILAILLALTLMSIFQKKPRNDRPAANVPPQPDLANLKPTDARAGDVISIEGAGDNMSDLDFTADRTTWVRAGARNWLEVSGPYLERRVSMRAANMEDMEVFVHTDPRKLTLADLGLSEDDLAEIDERQNPADSFEFDGVVWLFRQSADASARREDQAGVATYYYWEFRQQDGGRMLTVRKPQGEPFLVDAYNSIRPGDVTIYRKA